MGDLPVLETTAQEREAWRDGVSRNDWINSTYTGHLLRDIDRLLAEIASLTTHHDLPVLETTEKERASAADFTERFTDAGGMVSLVGERMAALLRDIDRLLAHCRALLPKDVEATAIRAGCSATDMHIVCLYPECRCKIIPAATRAILAVANRAPLPAEIEAMVTRLEQWDYKVSGGTAPYHPPFLDKAAALLRRWPRQDAPLPAEVEAMIARIQARPGADWDRETVALLRRWPR